MVAMFQKRHMERIAEVISNIEDISIRTTTAIRFAEMLMRSNPRFKHEKFMKASGVDYATIVNAFGDWNVPLDMSEFPKVDANG
jgi:hypothetical protein